MIFNGKATQEVVPAWGRTGAMYWHKAAKSEGGFGTTILMGFVSAVCCRERGERLGMSPWGSSLTLAGVSTTSPVSQQEPPALLRVPAT